MSPRKRGLPTTEELKKASNPELVELFQLLVAELKEPVPVRLGASYLHQTFIEALAK
jgi:hypothetical protein